MLKSFAPLLASFRAPCLAGLVLIALLIPVPATAGVNDWTSSGPFGGSVTSFAVAPSAPHVVYAWSERQRWRSGNRGTTWREIETGLGFDTALGGGPGGDGQSGDATAIPLAPLGLAEGGVMAFFSPTNPEILVKVLDG